MGELLNFDVGQHGHIRFLATRAKGREIRQQLEYQIEREHPDEVVIDFADVEAMTISFADELIGRFYASLAAGDIPVLAVVIAGLNEENLATASVCLERRELAAIAIVDGQPALISALDYLAETYTQAKILGTFSALDLARQLAITPQNVNNRLKRLVEAGAIRRQRAAGGRGGKEYTYTAPNLCLGIT